MGDRGPIPKRSDQLIRRNTPDTPVDKVTQIGTVLVPDLDIDNAHPLVVDLYESLRDSGQAKFYEPSDWQTARLVMYALNEQLRATYKNGDPKPLSSVMLQVINQMMSTLLFTEGDRRRVRLEVERSQGDPQGAQVFDMAAQFQQKFSEQTAP